VELRGNPDCGTDGLGMDLRAELYQCEVEDYPRSDLRRVAGSGATDADKH
jgi:hypothetical protein